MSDRATSTPPPATPRLAVVNWEYPDRTVVSGCPIDYEAAQALARAYCQRYPERRSWVSIPAPLAR